VRARARAITYFGTSWKIRCCATLKKYIISEANLWHYKRTIIGHKFNE